MANQHKYRWSKARDGKDSEILVSGPDGVFVASVLNASDEFRAHLISAINADIPAAGGRQDESVAALPTAIKNLDGHTPGRAYLTELRMNDGARPLMVTNGDESTRIALVDCMVHVKRKRGYATPDPEGHANAERLALAWNCLDALLPALDAVQEIARLVPGGDAYNAVLDAARAAVRHSELAIPSAAELERSRLADAAPDMLAALVALQEWAGIMGGFESPCWDVARTAIAKARGE